MFDQIREVSQRLRHVATKALVKAVDDSKAIQILKLQIMDSELLDSVERLQSYGLSANPPLGSESVVVEMAGARDNLIALVIDSAANRVKNLLLGETCFYSMHGQTIKHDASGNTLYGCTTHKFNGGSTDAARKGDTVVANGTTDPALIAWLAAAHTYLAVLATAAGATMPALPSSITGEITTGTSEVKLP